MLLGAATGWSRAAILAHPEREVPQAALRRLGEWLGRRTRDRVPLQYLTRRQEFWSLDLYVDERVLIPRPETECLVEELLRRGSRDAEVWADVGTGSGAVALALASERPDCRVLALDVSRPALAVAALNCRRHSGPGERVQLAASDLLQAVGAGKGAVRRIAANLPYLSAMEMHTLAPEVSVHEPRRALVAGEDAVSIIARLIPQAARVLPAEGTLHLEIAPPLCAAVQGLLEASGSFGSIEVRRDGLGLERIVSAVRVARESEASRGPAGRRR